MDEKKMIPCIYMSMGRAVTGFGQKTIFEDGDLLKLAKRIWEYRGRRAADFNFLQTMQSTMRRSDGSKRSVRKQKFR